MIYISLTCGYPAKHLWLVQRKVYNPEGSDADMRCGPNFLGKNNYKKKKYEWDESLITILVAKAVTGHGKF